MKVYQNTAAHDILFNIANDWHGCLTTRAGEPNPVDLLREDLPWQTRAAIRQAFGKLRTEKLIRVKAIQNHTVLEVTLTKAGEKALHEVENRS